MESEIIAIAQSMQQMALQQQLGTALLRKSMDIQAAGAEQLIAVAAQAAAPLPDPSSALGQSLDVYA